MRVILPLVHRHNENPDIYYVCVRQSRSRSNCNQAAVAEGIIEIKLFNFLILKGTPYDTLLCLYKWLESH